MRIFTITTLLSLVSINANSSNIYLQNCMNFGNTVQYSFLSCVDRNFMKIQNELDAYFPNCGTYNTGSDRISYAFSSCVNNAFNTAARELNIYTTYCSDYSQMGVSYSYISCLNNNFSRISYAINQ